MSDNGFWTDEEMIAWMNVPEKHARDLIRVADHEQKRNGFPPKIPSLGGLRHKESCKAWFDHTYGSKMLLLKRRESNAA